MSRRDPVQIPLPGFDAGRAEWRRAYGEHLPDEAPRRNRSGLEVRPLYSPADWDGARYVEDLGFPGAPPFTRGIYPTMHRGRS